MSIDRPEFATPDQLAAVLEGVQAFFRAHPDKHLYAVAR